MLLAVPQRLQVVHAGLRSSVGCASDWWSGGCIQFPLGLATFCRADWSWSIFYNHSLPSADSRRAVVSFWQKNVHKYWLNLQNQVVHMIHNAWKRPLCSLWTKQAQISLHICADWSGPLLLAYRISGYYRIYWQTVKAMIRPQMHRLIWAFPVHLWHKGFFRILCIICMSGTEGERLICTFPLLKLVMLCCVPF